MLSRVRLVVFSIKIGIFSKNGHIYYYNENKGDIMPIFSLFKYFSPNIQRVLDKFFSESNSNKYLMLEEIRLRSGRPVILKLANNEKVLRYIIDIENKTIYNTIIVSPPGAGKITILRDAVRKISNGIENIGLARNECWYD